MAEWGWYPRWAKRGAAHCPWPTVGSTVVQSFLSIMKKQNFHLAIESFELIAVGSRAG